MDSAIEAVLRQYEQRRADEMKRMQELPPADFTKRSDAFLLAVGPATGQLMNLHIKEAKARTILELGTSHGYSTVWLAEAARATAGKVISVDVHAGKQEYARAALSRAGLAEFAEFKLGDAREAIAALPGPFDFVLLDLWKDLYSPCFDPFYPKLGSGAMVVADNMIFPEFSRRDAEDYRRHVRARRPTYHRCCCRLGAGSKSVAARAGLSASDRTACRRWPPGAWSALHPTRERFSAFGETEHALADHVLLHRRGATRDRHRFRLQDSLHPIAMRSKRRVRFEHRILAE